jgi:alpha/beta superfamily hydrolase
MIATPTASIFSEDRPAARLRSIDLAGPAGRLENILNEGRGDAPYAALVCHPHPKGGGSMHNKVVYHAMKVLNDPAFGFGLPVLRFNYRGVGLSQGTYDGRAEAGDVQAALSWLENEYKLPIIACGFSFGAALSILACCNAEVRNDIRALVALGLPTEAEGRQYAYPMLPGCGLPKLFLSGDSDGYAPAASLRAVVEAAADPKQLLLIAGSDHFFTGYLEAMQQALAGWLQQELQ